MRMRDNEVPLYRFCVAKWGVHTQAFDPERRATPMREEQKNGQVWERMGKVGGGAECVH